MNEEQIAKAKMTNAQLGPEEIRRIKELISDFKRYVEVMFLIPGAEEEEKKDPEGFLKRYRLGRSYRDEAWPILDRERGRMFEGMTDEDVLPYLSEAAFRMIQFSNSKALLRDRLLHQFCVPQNERMRQWRERQVERYKALLGSNYSQVVHTPLCFELSDGCSVGCDFCAIGARKLKSVFRYTEDNAALFDGLLDVAKEMIGPAAGSGTLYYGSEALDNPDYEKFADAFFRKTGFWPQVTTAVPLRDRERMHRLLQELDTKPACIYRFSLRSLQEAREVLQEFDPREMMLVELLPQYKEAPAFAGFSPSGRARENGLAEDGKNTASICCVSGFVVNLAQRSVRMITPVPPDSRYPGGEVMFAKESFRDAGEFRAVLQQMMDRYMRNELPREKRLKLYKYFHITGNADGEAFLKCPGYQIPLMEAFGTIGLPVLQLLQEGTASASEIVNRITDAYAADPVDVYRVLHRLWEKGAIDEFC